MAAVTIQPLTPRIRVHRTADAAAGSDVKPGAQFSGFSYAAFYVGIHDGNRVGIRVVYYGFTEIYMI